MHDAVRNKQRSMSANMKTLKSQIDLRKQIIGLNYPDRELFLNHKQFSVPELLTHFENLAQAPLDCLGELTPFGHKWYNKEGVQYRYRAHI